VASLNKMPVDPRNGVSRRAIVLAGLRAFLGAMALLRAMALRPLAGLRRSLGISLKARPKAGEP
jgi:hypothetical protein